MSINNNEIFYGVAKYDPQLWYPGYDPNWVLGKKVTVNPAKEVQKPAAGTPKKGPIELSMHLCCEGCVEKVKTKLINVEGVISVDCDITQHKVTVGGDVKPEVVLKAAKKISKRAAIWKKEEPKKK